MHVSALRIYPLKSAAGIDVEHAAVHPWGLESDRRWMVVDSTGTTVTARTHRRLLHVAATPQLDGALVLAAPGRAPLTVPAPVEGAEVATTISRLDCARAAGPAADEWLSDHLREPVSLVWLDDPQRRTVAVNHGGQPGDVLSLADAGPILLTSTRSLTQLEDWMAQTAARQGETPPASLPMVRFRPNVVVDGIDEPFVEDGWKRVRIGEVELRFGEHCDRCVLPTIDPVTLAGGKEPTRTLALRRQWDHEVFFGVRLIPMTAGVVRLGDEVVVSDVQATPSPQLAG